ncbi:hypothetical protein EC182770_4200 [Escherichia coli 1827-70]|nr:hypothetical protein EC182770_4200 [Escherichia coli 1827-70]
MAIIPAIETQTCQVGLNILFLADVYLMCVPAMPCMNLFFCRLGQCAA